LPLEVVESTCSWKGTMRAIQCERYGPPEVLRLRDVPKPSPKDDEVLIEVRAASVNPYDWHLMRGAPFLARMGNGFRRPKDPRFGADVAGRVESVGKNVTRFKAGDEVIGFARGSFAEYATAAESELALKPPNLSFEASAAAPMAALTALKGLRDQGHVRSGQAVLVNGASGGVGTFAVQIAKSFGAEVTGVCSTPNIDLVRSIGADHVIDYTREDFTRNGERYDLILDAVGNQTVSGYKRALKPGGIGVVVGFTSMIGLMRVAFRGKLTSKNASKKVGMMMMRPKQEDRAQLTELLASGKVVPVIDRSYPLIEVPEAIRYLEGGHARGKVTIRVEPIARSG
jgi:NADPH:quinone reductase-like Zn-dependent oxidoreductase